MTTVAIPAEGLVKELHITEKRVLTGLFGMGGTVRTLVAEHLDDHTYLIYFFLLPRKTRERDAIDPHSPVPLWKPSVTRDVTSVLQAIKRLEQLGLLSRIAADSTSKVCKYHENTNAILAASIEETLESLKDDWQGEGIPRSEFYLTPEGEKMTHFIWRSKTR